MLKTKFVDPYLVTEEEIYFPLLEIPDTDPPKLYFQGGTFTENNIISSAFILEYNEEVIARDLQFLPLITPPQSQYLSLIQGLKCSINLGICEIEIYGSLEKLIKNIDLNMSKKEEDCNHLFSYIINLLDMIAIWSIDYIEEHKNCAHSLIEDEIKKSKWFFDEKKYMKMSSTSKMPF